MCTSQPHINIPEMIWKKREKQALTKEEIHYFVRGVTEGSIQDSQIGAMLMAIRLQGMTREEAVNLTQEMKVSGAILQWPKEWSGLVVDKHSTGGVGDKVSLILAPALAACGCKVPMISGRGLGHTGGTLDKLESIPGFNIKKNPEEVDIGNRLGIQTLAALSRMDNPIGRCVGNSLEVLESIECLKGNGPKDLEELVTCLGGHLLHLCGKAESVKVGEKAIKDVLKNCSALDKFQAMLVAQGVTAGLAKDLCQGKEVLKRAEKQEELKAEAEGVVQAIHSLPLAKVVHELGAGRNHPEESINWSVGIELLKTVGNKINKGDSWIRVHFEDNSLSEGQKISLQKSLVVGEKVEDVPLVTEIIGAQGQKKHKCAV
ncbi:thymidine phosphorylase isoform X3 [Chiloscyllium plagiosum]|uniref:thymidine phosphorylase isoform X3 n=1 Tax=Chiloscyllium plagiosum TaxID=36176 RepID=UPI001CB88A3C|nr:thymidine phosphorylase isoform X3 [Chiloscyllium plagiosum]